MNKKLRITLIAFIIFLAFFLRFYKLGEIPYGFYQDESAIGYNAYSILETGRDEYGKSFPLYFKSFGDWKLPVYIYSTVVSIKIFGLNEFAVRFPSAFFGSLSIIIFYLFVKETAGRVKYKLFEKEINTENIVVISSLLLAINPWHLHYSRATFEVSIALFLFLLGGFLLVKAFHKNTKFLFLAGTICFILALYSYNLTRLLAPFLYFLFIWFYKSRLKLIEKKEFISTIVISFGLLVPFFLTIFEKGGFTSSSGTLISTSAQIQSSLLEFRSYLISLPALLTKVFFNMKLLTLWKYIENVYSYFSVSFLFISGSNHGNHGIGNVGQLYMFELPFIVMGLVQILKDRNLFGKLLLGWAVITILVAALTRESPHATRSFFLIIPLQVFSAYGIIYLFYWFKNINNLNYRIIFYLLTVIFISYNLLYYFTSYYFHFPVLYAKAWRSEDKALSLYIKENESKYQKIIFDQNSGFIYSSLLFYLKYPPLEFQKTITRSADDSEGFNTVKSFGKIEFKDIDWEKDLKSKNTLFIVAPDQKTQMVKTLKTFYYPQRPVVYSVKQKIIQMPVEEAAYILAESR